MNDQLTRSVFDEARIQLRAGRLSTVALMLSIYVSGQLALGGEDELGQLRTDLLGYSATANALRRSEEPSALAARAKLAEDLAGAIDALETIDKESARPTPAEQVPVTFEDPPSPEQERVWKGTLQSLAWLHRGIRAARAVCRVVTPLKVGTGFVVNDSLLVTNNHVIGSAEIAAKTFLEFNFQEDETGAIQPITKYRLDPTRFATSAVKQLDCTVVGILDVAEAPLQQWGELSFTDSQEDPPRGSHVSIIQHPLGGLKQISVTANEVVNLFGDRVHYMTDTQAGSSGSPVFDDTWNVIAVHRAGGNLAADAAGGRIFANEGTLVSRILADEQLRSLLRPG